MAESGDGARLSRSGRWPGFIEFRRRYVSDRTWLGLALLVVGVGRVGDEQGWTRAALIALGLLGLGMVE